MKTRTLPLLLLLLALPLLPGRRTAPLALGYYTGSQASLAAVQRFTPYLDLVSVDVYTVGFDGAIQGGDDLGLLAYTRAHGLPAYLCVSNYNSDPAVDDFDPALGHAAIVTYRQAVITRLLSLAQQEGYAGVNIDFEGLAYAADLDDDRAAFSSFIHDLATRLHAAGLKLIISVPATTADSAADPWNYPFDQAALGQEADYLQLMTYDQHGPWGAPGPVAGADWVAESLQYSLARVAPARLLIGLPAYGYAWDLTASDPAHGKYVASSFSWTDIPALLAQPGAVTHWDAAASAPSVTYTRAGHAYEAWYENPASLQAKTALMAQSGLAGLSMWSLGQEDAAFWQSAAPWAAPFRRYLPVLGGR